MDGVVPNLGLLILLMLGVAVVALLVIVIVITFIWRKSRRIGVAVVFGLLIAAAAPFVIGSFKNQYLRSQVAQLTILPGQFDLQNRIILFTDTYYPGPRCQAICVELGRLTDTFGVHVTYGGPDVFVGQINLLDLPRKAQVTLHDVAPVTETEPYSYVMLKTNARDMSIIDPARWNKYRNAVIQVWVVYAVDNQTTFSIASTDPVLQIVQMEFGYFGIGQGKTVSAQSTLSRWVRNLPQL